MADNGFQGYQSGGRNFISPNRQVEAGLHREVTSEVGDIANIKAMQIEEVLTTVLNIFDKFAKGASLTTEQLDRARASITKDVMKNTNPNQAMNAGVNRMARIIPANANMLQNFARVRGTDNGTGPLSRVNNSPFLQSVQLQQEMLSRFDELIDKMDENTKNDKQGQDEEEGLFETLRQTIVHSVLNSPTANKLGQLGTSLMSAGLFRVASNEKMPSVVRQAAMGAVYLQVPETIMGIVGTTLSTWLTTGGSKILTNALGGIAKQAGGALSGFMGNAGSLIMRALPVALPIILAGAGIFALIKGISDHKKNMKAKDAEIANDPTLTQAQKDRKRLGEHAKSGAKVGATSGALIGAAIGTFIAPGIGTAIGGALGGAIGGAGLGALIGSLKPLGGMMKHGLASLGEKITTGAKWAVENKDKIMARINPVLDIVKTVLEAAFPFFSLIKLFINKITGSDWSKGLLGDKSPNDYDNDGGGGGGTPISLDKTKGGRPVDKQLVDLRDAKSLYGVNLKGSIQNAGSLLGNSKPWTRKENLATFAYLDNTLANMGINAVYSSNMGGSHKKGAKSHGHGDKVDVVGQSWTPEQYRAMFNKGFFGGNTGALGYEYKIGQTWVTTPEMYEKLYKERGGKMMGGNNHYDLTNKADLINVSSDDKFYDEYTRIQKAVKAEQKAQSDAEKKAVQQYAKQNNSDSVIKNIVNPTASYLNTDISDMDRFTKYNTTSSIMNVGGQG